MKRVAQGVLGVALIAVAGCRWGGPRVETEVIDGQRVQAEIYDLEYRVVDEALSPEEAYGVGRSGSTIARLSKADPLGAEPEYASKRVFRGDICLARGGNARFAVVLDAANGQAPPYDRLYVDANNDRDLTNDPVIKAAKVSTEDGGFHTTVFPPVTLHPPEESGGPHAVAILAYYVKASSAPGGEYSSVQARSACYWEGRVRFAEQRRRVVVLDGNCNGVFNDRDRSTLQSPYAVPGDELLVLPDGEEPAKFTPAILSQAIPLGPYVAVGDSLFDAQPEPDGSRFKVYRRKIPTAALRVNAADYRLVFVGDNGPVVIQSSSPDVRLPIGKYRLMEQAVLATDQQGRSWVASISPSPIVIRTQSGGGEVVRPAYGAFDVTAESSAEISASGPPFVLKLNISTQPAEQVMQIGLSLASEGGGGVYGVMVDGTRPAPPKFQIVSADGKLIAEEQFEYG